MEQLVTITTIPQLKQLQKGVSTAEWVAYDTETNGVEKESIIIGLSVAMEYTTGYYVVIARWDVSTQAFIYFETASHIKEFLEVLKTRALIMHNAPFDCWMTANNYGVELMPSVHTDTMIAGHLLNENRRNGLKELGVSIFGEDAAKESIEMKASVTKNGGSLTKTLYELYKADWELIAKYGAKDALLTIKLFHTFVEQLFEEGLNKFFWNDESMPLLRGPTYDMNCTGLRVDPAKLQQLRGTLEVECMEAAAYINKEVYDYVKAKYPGTTKTNQFNFNATQQLSWLLFEVLGEDFTSITEEGRNVCKKLDLKIPYYPTARRAFVEELRSRKDQIYTPAYFNQRTKKKVREKKIGDYWKYISCGKETIEKLSKKYKWCARLLAFKKADKLLNTYVLGIQEKIQYNIIRPSFFQHGTTSGRYSCRSPNFQNLPRDDKRIKACVVARPGKVFVGADYSQLEPRIFASYSGDKRLLDCFKNGDDFYSVVGAYAFGKTGCSLKKDAPNSFAKLYPELRQEAKTFSLAAAYGTTAFKMSRLMNKTSDDTQSIIDTYFKTFPGVRTRMLWSHEQAKQYGRITNLYGRPRRIPKAMEIVELFGASAKHKDLPSEWRTFLNLAMNHPIQSTAASLMNRAAIAVCKKREAKAKDNLEWLEVKIVLQVHDELVLEGPESLKEEMKAALKDAMENTCTLPGVDLIAEPKVAYNLADLK